MSSLFLLLLFATSCYSQGDKPSCQDIDKPLNYTSGCCGIHLASDELEKSGVAASNQFPWLALLENESGDYSFTGALISSRHVLITAVINLFQFKKVRLGVFNRNQTGPNCVTIKSKQICNDGAVTIAAVSMMAHGVPSPNGVVFDISIVLLAHEAPHNEFIRPICLPTSDILDSTPYKYHFVKAGWSRRASIYEHDVVKHYVTLPHVKRMECQRAYNSVPNTPILVLDNEICAGGESDQYQPFTCNENAGGPLMFKENGRYTLVGITTFGSYRCGIQFVPDVFTKIYPYLPWINRVAGEMLEDYSYITGLKKFRSSS